MPPEHFLELNFDLSIPFRISQSLLVSLIDALTLEQAINFEDHIMPGTQHVLYFTIPRVRPKLVLQEFCNLRVLS